MVMNIDLDAVIGLAGVAVAVFAFVTTANLIIAGIDRRDQAMRIRKLEKEIEEMKRPKGEEKGCDD